MTDFDKAIDIALRTWYPKDHKLHLNPHHPLGKLLGEWGELLNDYANTLPDSTKKYFAKLLAKWGKLMNNHMKSLYKPDYVFEPEDELGDIWYYLRILAYQKNRSFGSVLDPDLYNAYHILDTDYLIAKSIGIISSSFINAIKGYDYHASTIDYAYFALIEIAKRYNLTLDDLTASNGRNDHDWL